MHELNILAVHVASNANINWRDFQRKYILNVNNANSTHYYKKQCLVLARYTVHKGSASVWWAQLAPPHHVDVPVKRDGRLVLVKCCNRTKLRRNFCDSDIFVCNILFMLWTFHVFICRSTSVVQDVPLWEILLWKLFTVIVFFHNDRWKYSNNREWKRYILHKVPVEFNLGNWKTQSIVSSLMFLDVDIS